jgi:hypothetical protein
MGERGKGDPEFRLSIRKGTTMDFIGEILSEPARPVIRKQRWTDLIREHPNLDCVLPRAGINPFTRQPMVNQARPDVARIVVDSKDVGSIS